MYWIEWTPLPVRDPWILRCMETGAAYPNGKRQNGTIIMGQHPKRFPTPVRADAYARKYGIEIGQDFDLASVDDDYDYRKEA